jgi:hypothetical protein
MHGGLELVREEGYILDFNRTGIATHEAGEEMDESPVHTDARKNVIEFDANRKPKRGKEKASEAAHSANGRTKSEPAGR